MSLYTTSHQEMLRRANAHSMTDTTSMEWDRNNSKGDFALTSRKREFHRAASAHLDKANMHAYTESTISRNVGRKAENISPKTRPRVINN